MEVSPRFYCYLTSSAHTHIKYAINNNILLLDGEYPLVLNKMPLNLVFDRRMSASVRGSFWSDN